MKVNAKNIDTFPNNYIQFKFQCHRQCRNSGISLLEIMIGFALSSVLIIALISSILILFRINANDEEKVKLYRELLWIHSLIMQGQQSHDYTGCLNGTKTGEHSVMIDHLNDALQFDKKNIEELFHIRILGKILMFYHFAPLGATTVRLAEGQRKILFKSIKYFSPGDEIILRGCNDEMLNVVENVDGLVIRLKKPLNKNFSPGTEIGRFVVDYFFLAEKNNGSSARTFFHAQRIQNKIRLYPLSQHIRQFVVSPDFSHIFFTTPTLQLWQTEGRQEKQWNIRLNRAGLFPYLL